MDSDAEWVGVDFEFGNGDPSPTTRPPVQPRPRPVPPTVPPTDSPHDAPEVEGTTPTLDKNAAIVGGTVGGILGVVLLLLLLYMLALRRKLSKAKNHGKASKYQLRVEDVAHLTNIDETTNTYVNTTDLQRLVSSVRAKNKSENRLPTPPRVQHQTPKPYRPPLSEVLPAGQSDNEGFRSDVVVIRAPMPLPNPAGSGMTPAPVATEVEEVVYCNLQEVAPLPLPSATPQAKVQAPKIEPPPPPTSKPNKRTSDDDTSNRKGLASPTAVARPAPLPPVLAKGQQAAGMASPSQAQNPRPPQALKPNPPQAQKPIPPQTQKPNPPQAQKPIPPQTQKPRPPQAPKPIPPPVASKRNKGPASDGPVSTSTPWKSSTPATPLKPSVLSKGKGLPPLKMALLPSVSRSSLDDACNTPDTSIIELTPDSTPTTDGSAGKNSIGAKVAFLEGKLKPPTKPSRAMAPRT